MVQQDYAFWWGQARRPVLQAAALVVLGLASYWVLALGDAANKPAGAEAFERLGQQAELDGNFGLAEQSLLKAAELSRLYQPRYVLAQYYFRRNDETGFAKWSRDALAVAPGDVTPILHLLWTVKPNAEALADEALSARPIVARQILTFLVQNGKLSAAAGLARHLAEAGSREDLAALLGFCETALAEANLTDSLTIWTTLCRRKLLPYEPGPIVTNGEFRFPTVSNAFDWHIESAARQGGNALYIAPGSVPGDSVVAWQYVALRTESRYHLRYEVQGPQEYIGWSVFYPAIGGWRELPPRRSMEFTAPTEIVRLALIYRRTTDTNIAISKVSIELLP